MPKKKADAQRAKARELYEQEGLSLAKIARKLNLSPNTVKSWNRRDGWTKATAPKDKNTSKNEKQTHPNTENLKHIKKGEKRALKHSLYVDHSNSKTFKDGFEETYNLTVEELLKEQIAFLRGQMLASQKNIEKAGMKSFTGLSKITDSYLAAIGKYETLINKVTEDQIKQETLKSKQLDNELKELERLRQSRALENDSEFTYRGISIDEIAPVFWELHKDIKNQNFREFVLPGGRGSTKSSIVSLEIIDLIEHNSDMHALVCRQIKEDLRGTVYNQMLWAIDQLGLTDEYEPKLTPLEITKKSTGQKIFFRGLDKPGSLKSIKTKTGYIGILWFEELDQIKGDESIRKVEQSIVRGGEDFYIFKSFNPPRSKNNWANAYAQTPKDTMRVYRSSYLDVPREWLGEPFIQEAEFLKEVNPAAYDNEYMGIANGSGGNVFPNLVERTITDEEIAKFDDIDQGLDFGWVHPTAFIRCQYYPSHARLYVFDEAGGSYIPNKEISAIIKEHGLTYEDVTIADSEDPRSINELNNEGVNVIGAKKGPNSRGHGYKWLASLKEIIVDPARTPNFYKQAVNLEYERDKDGNITSLIPKINDDWTDALIYAVERHSRRKYDPFD